MNFARILLVYMLVVVMLPWGAWANAAAAHAVAPAASAQVLSAPDAGPVHVKEGHRAGDKISAKTKRCRIAVLAGIACGSDGLWHRAMGVDPDGRITAAAFFAEVILPRGVAASGHLDPPRQS